MDNHLYWISGVIQRIPNMKKTDYIFSISKKVNDIEEVKAEILKYSSGNYASDRWSKHYVEVLKEYL